MKPRPVPPCPAITAPGKTEICDCRCYRFQGVYWARRTLEGLRPTEPGCPTSGRTDVCGCVGCTWDGSAYRPAGAGAADPQANPAPVPMPAPAPDRPAPARTAPARPRPEPQPEPAEPEPAAPALSIPDVTGLDLAEAAQAYAAAGWYVVPIDLADLRNAGAVLGKAWPSKTSNDPATVARWFSRNGEAYLRTLGRLGIALHVGRSGAVALDIDHPEHLPELVRRAIKETAPPWQSSRENAPGRGAYLWRLPAGLTLGNSAGSLATTPTWGEVKGMNGTVHVMPTEHHKASEGGRYLWVRTGPLPVLPDSLAKALTAKPRGNDGATTGTGARPAPGNVRARVKGVLDKVLNAEPGERNQLLHWAAARFGELVAAGAVSEAIAEHLLTRAGEAIGLEPAEVAATVASGLRAGMGAAS